MKYLYSCIILLFAFVLNAQGKDIVYQVNGENYEGYHVKPEFAQEKYPLVIILHDWDGLTAYEKKRAHMLAFEGYEVFAADLFGQGVRPTENTDKRQHTGELYQDRAKLRSLIQGAIDAAAQQGADAQNTVVMGYCFGGAAVLEFARSGVNLKGFASFHGGLETPKGQSYANTKSKIMVFHGAADGNILMEHFAQLSKELETHQVPNEMTAYGGAPHSFTVWDSGDYTQEADKASWNRLLKFLQEVTK